MANYAIVTGAVSELLLLLLLLMMMMMMTTTMMTALLFVAHLTAGGSWPITVPAVSTVYQK